MSLTRSLGDGGWAASCAGNPPPLHVYDTESIAANWYPGPHPAALMLTQPDGPRYVFDIPSIPFGDDPTNPAQQTKPRIATMGMIGRFHAQAGGGK